MRSGAAVAPSTYWFWSEIPSRGEAERQTREMAHAGFSTVMIQARLSFAREHYLSPEYLAGYRVAVEAAAGAGLQVGIYDDYNWASGHAGGRTVAGAGHLRERHLFWSTSTAARPAAMTISGIHSLWFDELGEAGTNWIYEGGVRRWDEWELVAAIAHPPQEIALEHAVDVTRWASCDGGPDSCSLTVAPDAPIPQGWVVTAFVSARCATSRLINYLDPRAAERFIEVTYEPYAEACHGLLGDPIRYFSFDHPYGGFYDWNERRGAVRNSLMWDPDARLHEHAHGLSLGRLLLAVIQEVGPAGPRARCDFFAAYTDRAVQSFFGTLARWTGDRGIGLTGHELLAHVGGWGLDDAFPYIDGRTNFGLDYFAVDRHRTETLVDASNFEGQLSARFGDSVARAHGRQRCIVEQYAARNTLPGHFAAGYWELGLDELRLQALRIHVLGGRQFLFHAFHQTDGSDANHEVLVNPRFDFPPACNFEPWFKHFRAFADESATVSAFIDGAAPIREVAIVYPLHTVWSEGPGHVHARIVGEWAQCLAAAGIGFDLIDDRALADAKVVDGRLLIDAHAYAAVVLAAATTLPAPASIGALERFAAAGGTLVATAPLPRATASGGVDDRLPARIAAVTGEAITDMVPTTPPPALARCHGGVSIDSGEGSGTLYSWAGRDDAGLRLVLLNDGATRRRVTIAATGRVEARRLVLEDEGSGGERLRPWPWSRPSDNATHVLIDLEPEEVAAVAIESVDEVSAGVVDCADFVSDLRIAGDELVLSVDGAGPVVLRTADGELITHHVPVDPRRPVTLGDGWTFCAGEGEAAPIDCDRGWEQQGWATFAGEGVYRCSFDAPRSGSDASWALVLPAVHCAVEASLNGAALGVRAWGPYRFEIEPGHLREHDNALELTVTNSAANRYYAGTPFQSDPQPSGLGAVPLLVPGRQTRRFPLVASETP